MPHVSTKSGTAHELHALEMPTGDARSEIWLMQPIGPALVMGSAQKPESFDLERLDRDGVVLSSRRSGGGAVFIEPASVIWIDMLASRSSRWWSDELSATFTQVGQVWQTELQAAGIVSDLCGLAPDRTQASAAACWAGVGWGELTVGGTKVLGLSQRRTRWGARIQMMAVFDRSPARVGDYLLEPARSLVNEVLKAGAASVAEQSELSVLQGISTSVIAALSS